MLKPGQWSDLLARLRKIENPVVPTKPSKYALPVKKTKRASDAHRGRVGRSTLALRLRPARVRLPARARPTAATWCARRRTASRGASWCSARSGRPQRRLLRAAPRPRGRGGRARAGADRPRDVIRPEPFATPTRPRPGSPGCAATRDAARRGASTTPCAVLNRALHAHRVARADPYVARRVRRAGAGGAARLRRRRRRWPTGASREALGAAATGAQRVKRSMEAPEERFAALLGGREQALAGEELVLRARADLDAGRDREAALQARVALEALLAGARRGRARGRQRAGGDRGGRTRPWPADCAAERPSRKRSPRWSRAPAPAPARRSSDACSVRLHRLLRSTVATTGTPRSGPRRLRCWLRAPQAGLSDESATRRSPRIRSATPATTSRPRSRICPTSPSRRATRRRRRQRRLSRDSGRPARTSRTLSGDLNRGAEAAGPRRRTRSSDRERRSIASGLHQQAARLSGARRS